MKIAVLNFSGNAGKTTLARHLLTPRIKGAELLSVESANADEGEVDALRGKEFARLQQYIQTVDNLVVDVGASNIEDWLTLMGKFQGSHEDFDYFVLPVNADVKQQRDTANTAVKLASMGVPADKIKIVLNRVDDTTKALQQFTLLSQYLTTSPVATLDPACALSENEIYQRVKHDGRSISDLASDKTDYKALIAKAKDQAGKIELADKLATKRLALGVLPELDACFAALNLV